MDSIGDFYAILLHDDQLRRAWQNNQGHEPDPKPRRVRKLVVRAVRALATRLEPRRAQAPLTSEPARYLLTLLNREPAAR